MRSVSRRRRAPGNHADGARPARRRTPWGEFHVIGKPNCKVDALDKPRAPPSPTTRAARHAARETLRARTRTRRSEHRRPAALALPGVHAVITGATCRSVRRDP
jgi:hypothetical protein